MNCIVNFEGSMSIKLSPIQIHFFSLYHLYHLCHIYIWGFLENTFFQHPKHAKRINENSILTDPDPPPRNFTLKKRGGDLRRFGSRAKLLLVAKVRKTRKCWGISSWKRFKVWVSQWFFQGVFSPCFQTLRDTRWFFLVSSWSIPGHTSCHF